MDAAALVRAQLAAAHGMLEVTMNDVTDQQAHWLPPGIANPIGATYHHVVFGEDMMLNEGCKQSLPLFRTSWEGRTLLSELPPVPREGDWDEWARRVTVDLPVLREYAKEVYKSTDDYLASLVGTDLTRDVNLGDGLGVRPLAFQLGRMLVHVLSHWGEIACLKGLQGAKGY